jgi:hypothetical protein
MKDAWSPTSRNLKFRHGGDLQAELDNLLKKGQSLIFHLDPTPLKIVSDKNILRNILYNSIPMLSSIREGNRSIAHREEGGQFVKVKSKMKASAFRFPDETY